MATEDEFADPPPAAEAARDQKNNLANKRNGEIIIVKVERDPNYRLISPTFFNVSHSINNASVRIRIVLMREDRRIREVYYKHSGLSGDPNLDEFFLVEESILEMDLPSVAVLVRLLAERISLIPADVLRANGIEPEEASSASNQAPAGG